MVDFNKQLLHDRRKQRESRANRPKNNKGDADFGFFRKRLDFPPDPNGGNGPTMLIRCLAGEYPVPLHASIIDPTRFFKGQVLPYYVHNKWYSKNRARGANGTFFWDTRDWCEGLDLCQYLLDNVPYGPEDMFPGIRELIPLIEMGWWHVIKTQEQKKSGEGTYEQTMWEMCRGTGCSRCSQNVPRQKGRPCYAELADNYAEGFKNIAMEVARYCACGGDRALRVVSFNCSSCNGELRGLSVEDKEMGKTSLTMDDQDALYSSISECPHCKEVLDDLGENGATISEVVMCMNDRCNQAEPRRAHLYDAEISLHVIGRKGQRRLALDTSTFDGRGFRIDPWETMDEKKKSALQEIGEIWDFHSALRDDPVGVGKRCLRSNEKNPLEGPWEAIKARRNSGDGQNNNPGTGNDQGQIPSIPNKPGGYSERNDNDVPF